MVQDFCGLQGDERWCGGRWRRVWTVHCFKMVWREVKLTTGAVERVCMIHQLGGG